MIPFFTDSSTAQNVADIWNRDNEANGFAARWDVASSPPGTRWPLTLAERRGTEDSESFRPVCRPDELREDDER